MARPSPEPVFFVLKCGRKNFVTKLLGDTVPIVMKLIKHQFPLFFCPHFNSYLLSIFSD